MAATRRAFSERPLPSIIVADSSFFFDALIDDGVGRHATAQAFAQSPIAANTQVVYSSLIYLEAPQCWKRLYRRGVLVPAQRSLNDPIADRMSAFSEAEFSLRAFLNAFNGRELTITSELLSAASAIAAEYDFP